MKAVLDNNLALVRLLVSHGSDVNIADTDSWTPLHAAAANGHHGEEGDGYIRSLKNIFRDSALPAGRGGGARGGDG